MSKKKEKKERPIVVVEGAPEWMVTFGDLMSLLLTFFILLFSISEVKSQKIYEMFKSFRTHFNITSPTAGFHVEQLSDVLNLLSEMAIELPDQKEGKDGKTKVPVENPFGEHAEVVRIDNNLLISINGRVLFDEDRAQLKDAARMTLERVRESLRGYNTRIRVIGHANPKPLAPDSGFRDHMDLGYERARIVMEFLVADSASGTGIREKRMEISSRGRTDLIPELKLRSQEDRRKLDRVEIMVTPELAFREL